jgi:hypothetical protein
MNSHNDQPMRIRKGQGLIRELPDHESGFGKVKVIERDDLQAGQFMNEVQELDGSPLVVSAQEPTVRLGDD